MSIPLSKNKLAGFRKFLQKKTRQQEGLFLIEGWHLLDEALKAGRRIAALIIDEGAKRELAEDAILERALAVAEEAFGAADWQVNQISDTKASQGVAALVERASVGFESLLAGLPETGPLRLLALDAVGDPGNCGSIVRACDWFGLDGVLLGRGCAELENGKTARATMGGLFHLPVAAEVDLPMALGALRGRGAAVATTELEGAISLERFAFPERCVLVIGNEARGVSSEVSELADSRVSAPRFGRGESLNAALAAAVFLGRWRL